MAFARALGWARLGEHTRRENRLEWRTYIELACAILRISTSERQPEDERAIRDWLNSRVRFDFGDVSGTASILHRRCGKQINF